MLDLPLGEIFAVGSALLWAVAVVLFKKVGERIPPLVLNTFKNVVAVVVLVPLCLVLGGSIPDLTTWEWVLVCFSGIVGLTLSDTFFFAALNRLGASLNAVVDCFYAPSMIGLAFLFLGDRLPLQAVLGACLVLSAILLGSAARTVEGRPRRDLLVGFLYGGFGMLLIATSVIVMKPFLTTDRILWITLVRLVVGTVPLLPAMWLVGEWDELSRLFRPSRIWRFAVPASLLAGVFAMLAWIAGMTLLPVSLSAILNQLSTIFIFILAALVLKEPVTARRLAAVVLAFAGAALVITAGDAEKAAPETERTEEPSTAGGESASRSRGRIPGTERVGPR